MLALHKEEEESECPVDWLCKLTEVSLCASPQWPGRSAGLRPHIPQLTFEYSVSASSIFLRP